MKTETDQAAGKENTHASSLSPESLQVFADVPFNRWPMVMSHDAATGYLPANLVTRFARTQDRGLSGQLDCGVRAFDLRPKYVGDHLYMHHGLITVPHLLTDAVQEVVAWANRTANQQELALLYIVDCVGVGCADRSILALQKLGVHVVTDCGVLRNLTLSGALAMSTVRGSEGHVLALAASDLCVDEHYDPSVACYVGDSVCFDEGTEKAPFEKLYQYMDDTVEQGAPDDGTLWMVRVYLYMYVHTNKQTYLYIYIYYNL